MEESDKRREKQNEAREGVGKSRSIVCFRWFVVARDSRKVGSLKRWVRSHRARWKMKNCTPLWRKTRLQVNIKRFGTFLEVEMSKRARWCGGNTPAPDHFWKLKCRKSVCRCVPEQNSKSKVKKCRVRIIFGRSDAVLRARRKSVGFVEFYVWPPPHHSTLHYTAPHRTTLHYTTLHYTTLRHAALHYATL